QHPPARRAAQRNPRRSLVPRRRRRRPRRPLRRPPRPGRVDRRIDDTRSDPCRGGGGAADERGWTRIGIAAKRHKRRKKVRDIGPRFLPFTPFVPPRGYFFFICVHPRSSAAPSPSLQRDRPIASPMPAPRLYADLAHLWPLLS